MVDEGVNGRTGWRDVFANKTLQAVLDGRRYILFRESKDGKGSRKEELLTDLFSRQSETRVGARVINCVSSIHDRSWQHSLCIPVVRKAVTVYVSQPNPSPKSIATRPPRWK